MAKDDPNKTTGRRRRRSETELRTLIVQAAAAEFQTNGYDGATTAEIARKADVTEAQLFRYFKSKQQLFQQTVFDPIDQSLSQFLDGQSASADFEGETLRYVEQLLAFLDDNAGALLSVLMAQRSDRQSAIAQGPVESLRSYFNHGAALLQQNRHFDTPDARMAVRVAFSSVLGAVIFRDWLFPTDEWSRDEVIAALNRFILNSTTDRAPPV